MIRRALLGLLVAGLAMQAQAGDPDYVRIDGSDKFSSVLPGAPQGVAVHAYWLRRLPVSNGEFRAFLAAHPEWQKGRVPMLLADSDYLGHWQKADSFVAPLRAQQPVTRVSWFAAEAYCESEGARLPQWYEWELAAAADTTRRDARADPAWRQQILDWYARPAGDSLADVGQAPANAYGVRDLQGLVWEWVSDFNSLVVGDEANGELQKICGSEGLSLQQKENYAVLMHVAMLSSLRGANSGHALGFRCARDDPGAKR